MLRKYPLLGLNGLSGLAYLGEKDGAHVFLSHTDRGPNGTAVKDASTRRYRRTFFQPSFRPFWVKFSVNKKNKEIKILKTVDLGMSGLPNNNEDEVPVDKDNNPIPLDINGIDPESICIDEHYVWMGEEYRPSILKLSHDGVLIKRYVPEGSYPLNLVRKNNKIFQVLPEKLKRRRPNRGFEGIACYNNKIYVILQSSFIVHGKEVLLSEFNPSTEKVEREFIYSLDQGKANKIGDLAVSGNNFYIIEQNDEKGPAGIHKIYRFNLNQVDTKGYLKKEFVVDLVKEGYDFAEKIEGLAVMANGDVAIVNDNDFGYTGDADTRSPQKKTVLGILKINEK